MGLETMPSFKPAKAEGFNKKEQGGDKEISTIGQNIKKGLMILMAILTSHTLQAQEKKPNTAEKIPTTPEMMDAIKNDPNLIKNPSHQLNYAKYVVVPVGKGDTIYAMAGDVIISAEEREKAGGKDLFNVKVKHVSPNGTESATYFDSNADGKVDWFSATSTNASGRTDRQHSSNGIVFTSEVKQRLEAHDSDVPVNANEILTLGWEEALKLVYKNKGENRKISENHISSDPYGY